MAVAVKKKSSHATKDGYTYLTKRIVVRTAKKAGRNAARNAMTTMGFVVTTSRGWVVKKYATGVIERISKIEE